MKQHERAVQVETKFESNIIPRIEANYENLTPLEKNIADFFIHHPPQGDLSAKAVASSFMCPRRRCRVLRRNAATPAIVSS